MLSRFVGELNIDRRSCIEIEHSESLCCAITLLIYLFCNDPAFLLFNYQAVFDKYLSLQSTFFNSTPSDFYMGYLLLET